MLTSDHEHKEPKVDLITLEQKEELEETFKLFDKTGDGLIGKSEIGTVFRTFNVDLNDD